MGWTMRQTDFEGWAADLRRMARVGPDELPLAPEIAGRILGPARVLFGAPGTGARLDGLRIIVASDHPDINFACAHELAEWYLRDAARVRCAHIARERAANSIAAAIIAPPGAVRTAHAHYGERILPLAKTFGLSQTAAVLRVAEVVRDERAVVTRSGHIFVRSQGAFGWAALAAAPDGVSPDGRAVRRRRLHGGIDEGRVALRVA